MATRSASTTTKKRTSVKRPNINQVRSKIREISKVNDYDEEILLSFAEFVNGGKFKSVEPTMQDLRDAVIAAFGYSSLKELNKDSSFKLFVKDRNLKMNYKESWLKVYRRFVGLPEHEHDSIGDSSINGIDVLRNFLPWETFGLDPDKATAEDIKSAFNQLARKYHPDHGGNPEIFEKLKTMRDSILSAY